MAPKSGNQELQLNYLDESLLGNTFRKGWRVEANAPQTFVLHLLINTDNTRQTYGWSDSTTILRNRKHQHYHYVYRSNETRQSGKI